ncbi:thermonuclease family protein [Synechococcus moorigangaii CMS01]|jgi:endonuclease YncB( thermonuclease family)|nr:thermonuclease family protein [Synechococcus moorigangaii CMS01]
MRTIIILLSMLTAPLAAAQHVIPGPIEAEVVRIIDGDTIEVRAFIWPGHSVETRVRLAGVDAPEIRRVQCEAEREAGHRAKAFVEGLLAPDGGMRARIAIRNVQLGSFAGRVIAAMDLPDGRDLGTVLLVEGLVSPYNARGGWCPSLESSLETAQEASASRS